MFYKSHCGSINFSPLPGSSNQLHKSTLLTFNFLRTTFKKEEENILYLFPDDIYSICDMLYTTHTRRKQGMQTVLMNSFRCDRMIGMVIKETMYAQTGPSFDLQTVILLGLIQHHPETVQ